MAELLPLIHSENEAGKATLSLPDDLDLPMAASLVESLRAAFSEYSDIVVIAATVERASTAAVQALVAATDGVAVMPSASTVPVAGPVAPATKRPHLLLRPPISA